MHDRCTNNCEIDLQIQEYIFLFEKISKGYYENGYCDSWKVHIMKLFYIKTFKIESIFFWRFISNYPYVWLSSTSLTFCFKCQANFFTDEYTSTIRYVYWKLLYSHHNILSLTESWYINVDVISCIWRFLKVTSINHVLNALNHCDINSVSHWSDLFRNFTFELGFVSRVLFFRKWMCWKRIIYFQTENERRTAIGRTAIKSTRAWNKSINF